jgi:hypothetical protein
MVEIRGLLAGKGGAVDPLFVEVICDELVPHGKNLSVRDHYRASRACLGRVEGVVSRGRRHSQFIHGCLTDENRAVP